MHFPEWLKSLHHDGSDKFISNPNPALGETIQIRLRVVKDAPLEQVLLHTCPNGEPAIKPMQPSHQEGHCRFWVADLPVNQSPVNYRFAIQAQGCVWWYNSQGIFNHHPLDCFDFKLLADFTAPHWLHDSVFYQIFPDRFASSQPATQASTLPGNFRSINPIKLPWGENPQDIPHGSFLFYGGDLLGITQRLDYLTELGVNALYLNPVFCALTSHRYDPTDYLHVDPALGGDEALITLRQALDARAMRYTLDIVPNHCGIAHPWFQKAQQDAASEEAGFFYFKNHPHDYADWLGSRILIKLNYTSSTLHQLMYAADDAIFRHWLKPPFSADGWRVDVGNMLARQDADQMGNAVIRGIRCAVKQTNPHAYLFAESFYDATPNLQGDQWDGIMNYAGFGMPLIYWLKGYQHGAMGWDGALEAQPYSTETLLQAWQQYQAAIPWQITLQQMNFLDSHDTDRIRTTLGGNDALHRLAAIIQFTYPGIPCVYYGDEIGMADSPLRQLHQRACMNWDASTWDDDLRSFYQKLIALRRTQKALINGGLMHLLQTQDFLAYLRESPNQPRFIITANRSTNICPAQAVPVWLAGVPDGCHFQEVFSGAQADVQNGCLHLPANPQGGMLWQEIG